MASAGYGSDDAGAIDILKTAKSLDCFAIAIIIKPFSFEGQRRLEEVLFASEPWRIHAFSPQVERVKTLIRKDHHLNNLFFNSFTLCEISNRLVLNF